MVVNNAGFGVNRTVLDVAKNRLMSLQNHSNDNVSALAMYALAKMGVNVKTNAIYRFDALGEAKDYQIEAFAYLADIFTMYGDKTRSIQALKKGMDTLNAVNAKYNNTKTLSTRVLEDVALAKKLLIC